MKGIDDTSQCYGLATASSSSSGIAVLDGLRKGVAAAGEIVGDTVGASVEVAGKGVGTVVTAGITGFVSLGRGFRCVNSCVVALSFSD